MEIKRARRWHLKIAIVTGRRNGYRQAIAGGLLKNGYKVALLGRRAAVIEDAARALDPQGRSALAIAADVADPVAVAAAFERG